MKDKDLKKISRQDLLEMLVAEKEKNSDLQKRLDVTNEKLYQSGQQLFGLESKLKEKEQEIAELKSRATLSTNAVVRTVNPQNASQELNDIFENAQRSADQYQQFIRNMTDQECERKLKSADEYAQKLVKNKEEFFASVQKYIGLLNDDFPEFRELMAETVKKNEENG
ncbi:MAG: hypothetical protein IJS90_06200 [Clostridia bacterium]|nr:hypothetical protein [Clostridia bacterium]